MVIFMKITPIDEITILEAKIWILSVFSSLDTEVGTWERYVIIEIRMMSFMSL